MMASSNNDKSWTRPWTMDEMINNAENWSLAGDAALLNTIKAFGDNLLNRTSQLSTNVDSLLHDLSDVSLMLDISQNEFQSLRNTQFIESRVYEDDETLDITKDTKIKETVEKDKDRDKLIEESVVQGLKVVEKYFDKIEVSISDSEDEEAERSYMIQQKDLYAERPLPLLIGSEKWYKKWHVGLLESSSESESERVSETYSDSDSEEYMPNDTLKGSETNSESDFSSRTSENRPVANSTFNDSTKKPDIFESSESERENSVPIKAPISNKNFADQLAAKLGSVYNEREIISHTEEINKKPIRPSRDNKFLGELISDEPPPLDDLEDTILPKSATSGLFSGGRNLFDEDDKDDLFWGEHPPKMDNKNTPPNIHDEKINKPRAKVSRVSKGLFDSDESSDDDIFVSQKKASERPPFLQPFKTTLPLFNDEPPDLEENAKKSEGIGIKKKPMGGVSIFGEANIFGDEKISDVLKTQQNNLGKNENERLANDKKNSRTEPVNLFNNPPPNLEEEEENLQQISETTKKVSLFDKEPIFMPTKETEPIKNVFQPKTVNLFGNDSSPKIKDISKSSQNVSETNKESLFDDENFSKAKNETLAKGAVPKKNKGLFDDDDDLFKDDLFLSLGTKKFTSNLFDDVQDDDFGKSTPKLDLFADLSEKVEENNLEPKPSLPSVSVVKKAERPNALSLFSDDNLEDDLFKEIDKKTEEVIGRLAEKVSENKSEIFESQKDKNEKPKDKEDSIYKDTQDTTRIEVADKPTKGLFDSSHDKNFFETSEEPAIPKNDFPENILKEETLLTTKENEFSSDFDKPISKSPPELQVSAPTPTPTPENKSQKKESVISLFGSTPPPVEEEWDTKSDNYSDTEADQFSYQINSTAEPASIFDNEPPSLGPNDSSGIVRDPNFTRIDTDEFFFNPHATSSRRLSSDIFSDQQSQDSFFLTKNNNESAGATSNLDIIEEDSTSVLDITPSGRLSDFDKSQDSTASTCSVFEDNPSVSEAKDKSKKVLNLFGGEEAFSDPEDLFFSKTQIGESKFSEEKLVLFEDLKGTESKLPVFSSKNNSVDKEDFNSDTMKKHEKVVEYATKAKENTTRSVPGKLKHNLNINVNALMPGFAPPKIRDITKSQSLDLPSDSFKQDISSVDGGVTEQIFRRSENYLSNAERVASFEDTTDKVEILQSITKDRARIPVRRKPSTRRGRREAIRSSIVLDNDENDLENKQQITAISDNKSISNAEKEFNIESTKNVNSYNNVVKRSASDNNDNLFENKLEETIPDVKEAIIKSFKPDRKEEPIKITKTKITDLFDNDDVEKGDLLGEVVEKTVKKISTEKNQSDAKKKEKSIFDSDNEDDLFSSSLNSQSKKRGNEKKTAGGLQRKAKSIFNDSSDDDADIFGASLTKKDVPNKLSDRKPQRGPVPSKRKLENIKTDEDPLSALFK